MQQNPDTALDSILESEKTESKYKVYPITIARYALLELIESPFITPNVKYTMSNLIPSIYIMTSEISELKGFNSKNIDELTSKALEWADEIQEMQDVNAVIKDITDKISILFKVAPDSSEEKTGKMVKGKKPQTVG